MTIPKIKCVCKIDQVDKSAIFRGNILDPSNNLIEIAGVTCIAGGFVEGPIDVFLIIVINRKYKGQLDVFNMFIESSSTIRSDGYLIYTRAVE